MNTARQTHPENPPRNLRTRATALKASVSRITGADRAAEAADPIFAAIGRHRAARDTLNARCNAADRVWVLNNGGDTSDEAMAPAVAARETAMRTEIDAFNALFEVRPTTQAGIVALIRHAGHYAQETGGGYDGGTNLEGVFDTIADTVERLCVGGAVPPPDQRSRTSFSTTVEAELVTLNEASTKWWQLHNDAGRADDAAAHLPDGLEAESLQHMAGMASSHSIRKCRENLYKAVSLPASTVVELGLQARLISAELNEWWDDNKQEDGELACRALLDRLMGLAGVARIPLFDLEPEDARDWLERPVEHYPKYHPEARLKPEASR